MAILLIRNFSKKFYLAEFPFFPDACFQFIRYDCYNSQECQLSAIALIIIRD